MASYDLTPSMAPFFDVHMVGPLLDFLREVNKKIRDYKLFNNTSKFIF